MIRTVSYNVKKFGVMFCMTDMVLGEKMGQMSGKICQLFAPIGWHPVSVVRGVWHISSLASIIITLWMRFHSSLHYCTCAVTFLWLSNWDFHSLLTLPKTGWALSMRLCTELVARLLRALLPVSVASPALQQESSSCCMSCVVSASVVSWNCESVFAWRENRQRDGEY